MANRLLDPLTGAITSKVSVSKSDRLMPHPYVPKLKSLSLVKISRRGRSWSCLSVSVPGSRPYTAGRIDKN